MTREADDGDDGNGNGTLALQQSKRAIAGIYRLIRDLGPLTDGPKAARDHFRQRVAGPDIGYLRSMLAALLDEGHLADWRVMSSYRPMRARK